MTVRKLLSVYKNLDNLLPKEILGLSIGDKLYDVKYIIIKRFFENIIFNKVSF